MRVWRGDKNNLYLKKKVKYILFNQYLIFFKNHFFMKEVEILVEVYEDKNTVLDILKKFNFKWEKETLDIYFFDPLREKFQINDGKYPTEWFRLRKKGQKTFMTYKKDNFKNGTWFYSDEEEIEISDFDIWKNIIEKFDFQELIRIDNKKYIYENELYEIVFEEVKDLWNFLEVEIFNVSNDADIWKIKREIQKFIDNLWINVSEELNMGKPEMMIKKIKTNSQ